MTPSDISWLGFTNAEVTNWAGLDHRTTNWLIVYILDDAGGSTSGARGKALKDVYVGESHNAAAHLRQHLVSPEKKHLRHIRATSRACGC
ncbi:hypothetical protein E8P82_07645 [Arthrobacter echini]|uniref:GIY-YIG nuclease family protein n=1 Tax=Arthrobacter echini TaxID=1529066 RepID=A0A4S5E5I1_9MICC|nr:hypothetical protein [Arthrobacter echini]THJ66795.1 hypothetical protein E8P82_07645 [Arthrobacter echini]